MIIDIKGHPAYLRRESEATAGDITELEQELINGLVNNVQLTEAAAAQCISDPSNAATARLINTHRALTTLLEGFRIEEQNFAFASDSFMSHYASLKLRLTELTQQIAHEVTARTVAAKPIRIEVTVNQEPEQVKPRRSFVLQAIGVIILVAIGATFLL